MNRAPIQDLFGVVAGAVVSGAGAMSYWLDVLHSTLGNVATLTAIVAGVYSIMASRSAIKKNSGGRKQSHEKHPQHTRVK